jgi:small subunit ribosomal protein S5
MNEEKKQPVETKEAPAAVTATAPVNGGDKKFGKSFGASGKGRGGKGFGFRKGGDRNEKKEEFDQKILEIARVTRVMAGGKRMRFRACVVIGDKKGKVGIGVGKGADVTLAVNKAVNRAKKEIIDVPIVKDTIPHEIYNKFCAAKIIFKPAAAGRGVKAGGVVRVILEMAGVKNITSKALGSGNKIANASCTIEALKKLKRIEQTASPKKEVAKPEVKVEEAKIEEAKKTNKKK